MTQSRTAAAIRAFEAGEIVVVTDDDGRENEGDLIVAASRCTAPSIWRSSYPRGSLPPMRSVDPIALDPPVSEAIERVAASANALAVILFGSRARGDQHAESDYDLCVVVPDDGARPESHTLRPHFRGLGVSVDLHVMSAGIIENMPACWAGLRTRSHRMACPFGGTRPLG